MQSAVLLSALLSSAGNDFAIDAHIAPADEGVCHHDTKYLYN